MDTDAQNALGRLLRHFSPFRSAAAGRLTHLQTSDSLILLSLLFSLLFSLLSSLLSCLLLLFLHAPPPLIRLLFLRYIHIGNVANKPTLVNRYQGHFDLTARTNQSYKGQQSVSVLCGRAQDYTGPISFFPLVSVAFHGSQCLRQLAALPENTQLHNVGHRKYEIGKDLVTFGCQLIIYDV